MTFTKEVKRFGELIAQGMSKIHEACELYVAVIDKYPAAKKSFKKNMPEIPAPTWTTFEKIGRKQLHERLIIGGGMAHAEMRKLSYADQCAVFDDGVELLLHDGSVRTMNADKLTMAQVRQVFANGEIRDIEEQRAWIETNRHYKYPTSPKRKGTYVIIGDKLVINAPTEFSKRQLQNVIAKMG